MCVPRPIRIHARGSGDYRVGSARSVQLSDKMLWTRWHEHMPPDAEDGGWDWDELLDDATRFPLHLAGIAAEAEGDLQGLMLLGVAEPDVHTRGLHVLRLATAPWNRNPESRYRGVGSLLLGVAILCSLQRGHAGRIHLESLPAAEAFYRRSGMIEDGIGAEELARFRFEPDAAWEFVRQLEERGCINVGS